MTDALAAYASSPWTLWIACALCGIGVPLPEEVLASWAGMQASAEPGGLIGAWALVGSGFFVRDMICWTLGRTLGERVLASPSVHRIIPAPRIDRARALVREQGGRAVLLGRIMVGMRSAMFVVAGSAGIPLATFVAYDVLGLCATSAVLVGAGAVLGPPLLEVMQGASGAPLLAVLLLAGAIGLWRRQRRARRGSGHES